MALKVKKIKDYIVEIEGANSLIINEVVTFENKAQGIVMKAKEFLAWVALFDEDIEKPIKIGSTVIPTGKEFSLNINENILGNIVNIEGKLLSDHKVDHTLLKSTETVTKPVFRLARPIYARDFVNQALTTGIAAVDWGIPIGKGQRELILGDRKTGKTSIALNAILAQKNTNVKSVYVAIGQKKTTILDFYHRIKEFGLIDKTIIVSSSADQTATKKWLAPYVGVTIAEYFQEKYGDDVLIIYDDLSKHADAYRELSLLMKSAPAREAYPGDIFYLHSKLLERAGKFNVESGGGSITALPVIQTEAGDITSYIPTNVISITDGQIFTSKQLFNAGHRPAIDIPYSVSRVGSAAQTPSLAKMASGLKLKVSQFEEAMKMTRLSGTVSEENRETIDTGRVLTSLLVQAEFDVLDYETGTLILSLFKSGYLNFYRDHEELIFIKQLINEFLKTDFLGKQLKAIISKDIVGNEKFALINREILLPMIKYHLLNKYKDLKTNEKFVETFDSIRNDGRIYKNVERKIKGEEYGHHIY